MRYWDGEPEVTSDRYACACCSHLTLSEPPGSFAICSVCYWEDDEPQRRDPSLAAGANQESLIEARKNFTAFGKSSAQFRDAVRKPTADEMPR